MPVLQNLYQVYKLPSGLIVKKKRPLHDVMQGTLRCQKWDILGTAAISSRMYDPL